MTPITIDLLPFVASGNEWMARESWLATHDEVVVTSPGSQIDLKLSEGDVVIGPPVVLAPNQSSVTVEAHGTIRGARVGIEWCHAKRGKYHAIVWATMDGDSFEIASGPSPQSIASFHFVVEITSQDGVAEGELNELQGDVTREISVLVNQVGYDPSHPKTVTVQGNADFGDGEFRVVAPIAGPGREFETVFEGRLSSAGQIDPWGRHYWRGDFSKLQEVGNYYVEVTLGGLIAESAMFTLAPNWVARETLDASQRFYWYQRCGQAVPGWHEACHMDDCVVASDGRLIGAAGAWHDAGDYNKYNGWTPHSVWALAYASGMNSDLFMDQRRCEHSDVLDEAIWGAEWLIKMFDGNTGLLRDRISTGYGHWGLPEDETDNVIGSDGKRTASEETSASLWMVGAMARLSVLARRPDFLGCAKTHLVAIDQPESLSSSYQAQRLCALIDIHRATGDEVWMDRIRSAVERILACQSKNDDYSGFFAASPDGDLSVSITSSGDTAASLALFALTYPSEATPVKEALCGYMEFVKALSNNPFGIMKSYQRVGQESWFFAYKQRGDWHVGQNSQYLSEAWAAFLTYQITGERNHLESGLNHLNWVLGVNPYGISMMEGQGTHNLPTQHHRYNMIPGRHRGAVPGSVVNGIVRFDQSHDIPLLDLIPQGTPRYECNEPWLPHNDYYLLAVSELARVCE